MPILATDARTISYDEWGAGPVLLLIHGSPGDASAWARVADRLRDRYRVIAPDLPGHGKTPLPAGREPDVSQASESVEAVIRHVGVPVVLAGHSYGGVVALAVALRGQTPLGALALFEPVALEALRMGGELAAYTMAKRVFDEYIARVETGDNGAVQRMVDFWFGAGAFDRLPPAVAAAFRRDAPANIRDVRATFRERYVPEAFRQLQMPVTVVVGEHSPDITQRIARVIAAHVPAGSVTTLAAANHALTATHADAAAQAIAGLAALPVRGHGSPDRP